jgi:hypothetical protein
VRVRRGVPVDQADDGAGEESAENRLQPERLGQRDEADEHDDRQAHPDLGRRVLEAHQHIAEPHRLAGPRQHDVGRRDEQREAPE